MAVPKERRCRYGLAGGAWGYWALSDGTYDQCRLREGSHVFHFLGCGSAVSSDGTIWLDNVSWLALFDTVPVVDRVA